MELKWFKATTYTQGFGYVLNLIRKELIALQPVDSPDIAWDRTTDGIKARIVPKAVEDVKSRTPDTGEIVAGGGGASSEYNGYFKVVDVAASSPAQIKIIDGANPAASVCGMADVLASVPVATITKTNGTIVYAIASYSSSVFTVTFQCSGTTPTGSVGYIPIASVAGDGTIRQLWVSNRLVFRAEFLI